MGVTSTGLLSGLSEALRGGLAGYQGERDRGDRLAKEAREAERQKLIDQFNVDHTKKMEQLAEEGHLGTFARSGITPLAEGGLIPKGGSVIDVGGKKFLYNPENTPEAAQRKSDREFKTTIAKMNADARKAQQEASNQNKTFQRTSEFRKEYTGLPTSKASQEVSSSYSKIEKAAKKPSAAGDIALLTGYMKLIDPGSTVREGEFATAQNAGGVPDQIRALYEKVRNGQRLSENQRLDFLTQARTLAASQRDTQQHLADQYMATAKKLQLNPEEVIMDYFQGLNLDPEVQGPGFDAANGLMSAPAQASSGLLGAQTPAPVGFTPEKKARLEELRRKNKINASK